MSVVVVSVMFMTLFIFLLLRVVVFLIKQNFQIQFEENVAEGKNDNAS